MSRLFSQLENIGHDRTDVERPAADQEVGSADAPPATQTRPHGPSAPPLPASDAPLRPNYSPASTAPSQIPGYAIASQLSLSSRPVAPAAPSRASWPLRLWFISLLALIGLSLAMLLSPRDDTTAAQRATPRSTGMMQEPIDDDEPSLPTAPPASSAAPAKAKAAVDSIPAAAAASVARPVDKPVVRRQLPQPPAPPADPPAAAAPRAPAGDAACSAAMAAMNLCSASHP